MIFKIHYGLWYGGLVGIIPFMFNYAEKYSSATATQQGILFTVLPFIALIAKPIVCSFADKHAAHRHCLLISIFFAILGYGSLVIYPFFPQWTRDNKSIVWSLYCLAALVGNTSMCVVNSLGDSLAINSCTRKNVSYGQYRLWGPIGFGLFGAIWGLSTEIPYLPKFTPGIITLILILSINCLILIFWRDDEEFRIVSTMDSTSTSSTISSINATGANIVSDRDNSHQTTSSQSGEDQVGLASEQMDAITVDSSNRVQRARLVWQLVCKQKSIIAYVLIFTFCGLLTGLHWQFFFPYIESIAGDKFIVIAALALPVQALGGELIFFMLSSKILERLGAPLTLVICLLSFATRYLLYAYLVPHICIYWILIVELLQGPAFGLMYCVLTHQANVYSERLDEMIANGSIVTSDVRLRKSLHATLQGALGAAFEGLGLGLGAIVGGLTYDISPNLMWQIAGFGALVVAILYLAGELIFRRTRGSQRADTEIET